MIQMMLINGLTKKRKRREVNRIPPNPAGCHRSERELSISIVKYLSSWLEGSIPFYLLKPMHSSIVGKCRGQYDQKSFVDQLIS